MKLFLNLAWMVLVSTRFSAVKADDFVCDSVGLPTIGAGACGVEDSCFCSTASIGANGCSGANACDFSNGLFGTDSCVGENACQHADASIGVASCIGENSCIGAVALIGAASCIGLESGDSPCGESAGTISAASCNGADPCRNLGMTADIGAGTCVGAGTNCHCLNILVGAASCLGEDACVGVIEGSIGASSCTNKGACYRTTGGIAADACTGEGSCYKAGGVIAAGSCTGEGSCWGTKSTFSSAAGSCTGKNSCKCSSMIYASGSCLTEDSCSEECDIQKDTTVEAATFCTKELFQGLKLESIRFNKFPQIEMSISNYPVNESMAIILQNITTADSVVIAKDVQLQDFEGVDHWISVDALTNAIIDPIYPTYANGTSNPEFWNELQKVVTAQIAREDDDSPSDFNTWPDLWTSQRDVTLSPWPGITTDNPEDLSLSSVAAAVAGEYPAYHQQMLIKKFFDEGLEMNPDLGQPFRGVNDFIGKQVRVGAMNTWAFEVVAPVNFMLKWHFGVPRPEELAWLIYEGNLTKKDGIPQQLIKDIRSMDLENAFHFTAFKSKGSPMHPSFPAMHAAGSTCSLWLAVICNLTPEQYLEALRVDYAVAYGRTIAGVHYEPDNIAGLNIGQRIVREKLPAFLAENYGYDYDLVDSKVKALSFDWNTFESATGYIDGKSAAEFAADSLSISSVSV